MISHFNMTHRILWTAIFIMASVPFVVGQHSPDAKSDPELEAAQRKQALAEANQAAAEAALATYKAIVGQIDTEKFPSGTTTATDVEIESKLLAYRSAFFASKQIVSEINKLNPKPTKIVIFSKKELDDVASFRAFTVEVQTILAGMKKLEVVPTHAVCDKNKPSEEKGLPALFAVDTALQVLALFRKDVTYKGTTFTLDDFAVYSMALSQLKAEGIEVYYPPMYYPNVFVSGGNPPKIYTIFRDLNNESQSMTDSLKSIAIETDALKKLIDGVKDSQCKAQYEGQLLEFNYREKKTREAQTLLDGIVTALMKPDEQTGMTQLVQYAISEKMASDFESSHLLQIKSVAAGGTSRIVKNIVGSRLSFGGGAILSYMLTDSKGAFVASGSVPYYGGFIRARDLPTNRNTLTP